LFDFCLALKQNEFVRSRFDGFTLMELMLVIAIMGILSAIGIGAYTQATLKSRDTERKSDLNQIAKAVEIFNNDIGRYPNVSSGVMICPQASGSDAACGTQIYAFLGVEESLYLDKVPTDPVPTRKYVYVPSSDLNSFSLFAALENDQDNDVVVDSTGNKTDWGISCGDKNCNYKLTDIGVVRVSPTPTP
jgi:type II secretion system protein G